MVNRRGPLVVVALLVGLVGLSQVELFAAEPSAFGGYLPMVFKPENTPTATPTAIATATATPTTTPAPAPGATATPTLPPPSFGSCATDPGASAAPNFPIKIIAIDKSGETVTIRNLSASTVSIAGWRICSITGGQQHALLSEPMAAGETRVVPSQASANIWNNSTPDPGALWTSDGRLVSYFNS